MPKQGMQESFPRLVQVYLGLTSKAIQMIATGLRTLRKINAIFRSVAQAADIPYQMKRVWGTARAQGTKRVEVLFHFTFVSGATRKEESYFPWFPGGELTF